jgi:hypothetical protein
MSPSDIADLLRRQLAAHGVIVSDAVASDCAAHISMALSTAADEPRTHADEPWRPQDEKGVRTLSDDDIRRANEEGARNSDAFMKRTASMDRLRPRRP